MEKFIELSEKWMRYVSIGHHKDRDCHWYITTDYAYGNPAVYQAEHDGYIASGIADMPERETYEEAQADLLTLIERAIRAERHWVDSVLANPSDYDEEQHARVALYRELFS